MSFILDTNFLIEENENMKKIIVTFKDTYVSLTAKNEGH